MRPDGTHVTGYKCDKRSYRGGKVRIFEVHIPKSSIKPLAGERDTLLEDLKAIINKTYYGNNWSLSVRTINGKMGVKLLMRDLTLGHFLDDARSFLGFLKDEGLWR